MDATHELWIAGNRAEYGDDWVGLRWASGGELAAARRSRDELLAWVEEHASSSCEHTKPHLGPLSPGCACCRDGGWSCLFVNGRCNGACFFCPTPQDEVDVPATSAVRFPSTRDYVAYVDRLGITGVGLSGGEPLLTPERSIELLQALSSRPGPRLHLWLYTNGLLLTAPLLERLRDAGLDEIRIDLFACGYDLEVLRMARRAIPVVTVEIPAIPEHEERLRRELPTWRAEGLDFLNLHQLRLTPHNRRHLVGRGYTFLPGPRVTVLQSELCALRLLRHSGESGLGLPINYCSFVYKQRFQALAARRRLVPLARRPLEEPTDAGYLRSLSLRGPADRLASAAQHLEGLPELEGAWELRPTEGRLLLRRRALDALDTRGLELETAYVEPVLREAISYRHPFQELTLASGRKLWIERRWAARGLPGPSDTPDAPHQRWERTEGGLLPYLRP